MKTWPLAFLLLPLLLRADDAHTIAVLGKRIPFAFDSKHQVIVIEGKVLQQLPALSLPALISGLANIHFIQRGAYQADPQLSGFNQEQMQVMINGMPINNSQTGHHNFLLPCDIAQVERIEISRHAYSSFCGSAGAAGTINIITAPARRVQASGGSFGTYSASMSHSGRGWSAAAGLSTTDGYQPGLDGNQTYLQLSGVRRLGKTRLEAWAGWTSAAFGANHFYAPYNSYEKVGRLLAGFTWRWPIHERLDFAARIYNQFTDDRYTLKRENPGFYFNRHKTWQQLLETELRYFGSASSFRAGFAIASDAIRSRGIRDNADAPALGNHRRTWGDFMAEYSREAGPLAINSGIRTSIGDIRGMAGHILTGWRLGNEMHAEISLHRNFRSPTFTELYYSDPSHRANPQLRPESSWGLSLGLSCGQEKTKSQVRLFLTRSKDLIDWIGDTQTWTSRNIQKATFWGLDLQQSLTLFSFPLKFLYSFQKIRFSLDPLTQPLKYHYYFPDHTLAIHFARSWRLVTLAGIVKGEREERNGRVRILADFRLGRNLGPLFFYLDALNLFNSRLEKIPGLLDPPRMVRLGLQVSLNKT